MATAGLRAASSDKLEEVSKLDQELRADGLRAANGLSQLLEAVDPSLSPPVCSAAAHAVRRNLPRLERAAAAAKNDATLVKWISARREEYADRVTRCVVALLERESDGERDACVRALIACATVQGEGAWKKLVRGVVVAGRVGEVTQALAKYADLRTWTLQVIAEPDPSFAPRRTGREQSRKKAGKNSQKRAVEEKDRQSPSHEHLLAQRLVVLHACSEGGPELASAHEPSSMKSGDRAIPAEAFKSLRRAFGEAWLLVLGDGALTSAQRAAAVAALSTGVIPRMSNPLRLADFLTDAYNRASTSRDTRVAVAALDALFVLISKHRLDYPDFYPKLYQRLTPYALFEAPERERFLSLTALFLTRGSYLPKTIVAAFIKRLARRALIAPPAGAMWCLRLALDLLHKHPTASFLVHKSVDFFDTSAVVRSSKGEEPTREDPFDDSALDPQSSKAEESSLWELEALRSHMSPAVSRLVEAFSRDVRKRPAPPPGNLEDYAGLEFSDIFGAEFKRRAKAIPLSYDPPAASPMSDLESELEPVIQWR